MYLLHTDVSLPLFNKESLKSAYSGTSVGNASSHSKNSPQAFVISSTITIF